MTWTQRLRLFGGIVAVLALTAVLVLVFNQRQAQALSTTGQVVSAQASVGAAYGGVVTQVDATEGDEVKKGQTLFTVNSPDLQRDLSQGLKVASTDAFDVDTSASTVTYKALSDGRLSDVEAQTGGFVQNGANLATITSDGSQYALADFVLSPRDYERIVKGAAVSLRLPDDRTVEGTVQSVSVLEHHQHDHPRRLHRRRVPRAGPAPSPRRGACHRTASRAGPAYGHRAPRRQSCRGAHA